MEESCKKYRTNNCDVPQRLNPFPFYVFHPFHIPSFPATARDRDSLASSLVCAAFSISYSRPRSAHPSLLLTVESTQGQQKDLEGQPASLCRLWKLFPGSLSPGHCQLPTVTRKAWPPFTKPYSDLLRSFQSAGKLETKRLIAIQIIHMERTGEHIKGFVQSESTIPDANAISNVIFGF